MPQTGATRYQKFLKKEKSKTKLKAKKDLPKGTNVTKTNFKVKKIVIKEQLKKHSDTEALSSRKLNVKDLLSRLNHFNVQSRTDALCGLKELIKFHSEVLNQNLGQLVNGVTPLLLNVEKTVRRESLQVLHLMLSNVSAEKIDPFFDIMCTYLRSAMTHIDSRIQEDSLLFLDTLLLCTPEKMAKDFHKIIPNFLDMISKLRVDSKPGRILTTNLDSQMTSAKWRVKVLQRLQEFIKKYVECNNISFNILEKLHPEYCVDFDNTNYNYYSLYNPSYAAESYLPCFSGKNGEQSLQDEVEKFKIYIETLTPLLFETWLEACPNTNKGKIETVLTEDAAGLLKHTLEVIFLIWKLVKHLDKKNPGSKLAIFFSQKYKQSFTQHIFQSFPYVTNIRNKAKSANTSIFQDVITDPKLVIQNLEICHLFITFNPNVTIKHHDNEISSFVNYIETHLNIKSQDHVNDVIFEIMHSLFSTGVTNWTKNRIILDSLFTKIIKLYFNETVPNSLSLKIFVLLCQIGLNDQLVHFHSSDAYKEWLKNLPDILMGETVTEITIDIIHKFAVRNNKVFNSVIQPKLRCIIENLPKIEVRDAVDHTAVYKMLSLLYWIKCWDKTSLDILEKQLLDSVYKNDYGKYIYDTLILKIVDKINT